MHIAYMGFCVQSIVYNLFPVFLEARANLAMPTAKALKVFKTMKRLFSKILCMKNSKRPKCEVRTIFWQEVYSCCLLFVGALFLFVGYDLPDLVFFKQRANPPISFPNY